MIVGALATLLASAISALFLTGMNLIDTLSWPLWVGLGALIAALLLALAVLTARYLEFRRLRERFTRYDGHCRELDNEHLRNGAIDLVAALARLTENLETSTRSGIAASLRRPSPAGDEQRWQLPHWPSHTPPESEAYQVPLDDSWLTHAQRGQPDERLFQIDDLRSSHSPGADLDALRRFGFETIVCARIARARAGDRQPTPCLVVVAKQAGAFSEQELSYLRSVARSIERHIEGPAPRATSTASRTIG